MHRKQQRKDLKPVRLGSWWYIGGFMTHVGLGNEAIHFTKEHLSWGFQDNFVSDHSIGLWKKLKGWKLWALMFATVKTSVCLGGWGEINQQEQMKIKNGLSLSLRVRVEFWEISSLKRDSLNIQSPMIQKWICLNIILAKRYFLWAKLPLVS